MLKVPQDRQYTRDDVWLRAEGEGIYSLGVSDFAQSELGELVFVELPEAGRLVKAGQTIAVVESVKSISEVHSPVAGAVVVANARLGENPDLINESPYDDGWIARIRLEIAPGQLLSPQQYAAWRRLDEK